MERKKRSFLPHTLFGLQTASDYTLAIHHFRNILDVQLSIATLFVLLTRRRSILPPKAGKTPRPATLHHRGRAADLHQKLTRLHNYPLDKVIKPDIIGRGALPARTHSNTHARTHPYPTPLLPGIVHLRGKVRRHWGMCHWFFFFSLFLSLSLSPHIDTTHVGPVVFKLEKKLNNMMNMSLLLLHIASPDLNNVIYLYIYIFISPL